MKDVQYLITSACPRSKEFSELLEGSSGGLKRYHLMMTAWDSGLFELTVELMTFQDLAARLGYHELMTQMFCEALVEIGLLEKVDGMYINSPIARTYLDRSSPHCMRSTMRNTKANNDRWAHLESVLKNGPIVQDRNDFFNDEWLVSIAEWSETGTVLEAMRAITEHIDIQRWRRLLDIGGGHGLYAIAFTALNPALEAVVFDRPSVIPLTSRYLDDYSADRVKTLPGDFYLDDIGRDYDAIFSSFNQSGNNPTLIPKLSEALRPGGDLVLRRFVDNDGNEALSTLDWNLTSFEGKKIGSKRHTSGAVLPKEEYLQQLQKVGFDIHMIMPVGWMSEIIFARKPSFDGARSDV